MYLIHHKSCKMEKKKGFFNTNDCGGLQESGKSKHGKTPHSAWCNYDDLNEYFWSVYNLIFCTHCQHFSFSIIPNLFHSGQLIVSRWVGQCGMMVIFSNLCMIQGL